MMELVEANWIVLVAALAVGLMVAWWVFAASRRTHVSGDRHDVLDEGADPAARNQALIDSAAAARADTPVSIPEAASVPALAAAGDDLTRIKGVGPKLCDVLVSLGVTRFDQIAGWSDEDIDRIDARLGRFEGRIRRDNWVEQAKLLAAGDTAGYEERFGKL